MPVYGFRKEDMVNLTNKEIKKVIAKSITYLQFLKEDDRRKKDRRTDKEKRIEWALNKALNGRR